MIKKYLFTLYVVLIVSHFSCLHSMELKKDNNNNGANEFSVIPWGASTRRGWRETNEDRYFFIQKDHFTVFGVFDGHGGAAAAKHAQQNYAQTVESLLAERSKELYEQPWVEEVLRCSFRIIDQKIRALHSSPARSGTTALIGLILGDKLYLAWAGDSRGMVVQQGEVVVTQDHKPNDPQESERLKKFKQEVSLDDPRFIGIGTRKRGCYYRMAVSRSLGIKSIKEVTEAIIAEPQIKVLTINEDTIIFFASDGFWDKFDVQNAHSLIVHHLHDPAEIKKVSQEEDRPTIKINDEEVADDALEKGNDDTLRGLCRLLRDSAFNRESKDNISTLLVFLQKLNH